MINIKLNQQHIDLTVKVNYKGYLISGINFFNVYNGKTFERVKADIKTIDDAKNYIDTLKPLKTLL